MTLSSGTRLGPYEILAPLGTGGMGEVYRARDTRLDRDVAIKVLPGAVATDPDALARFEREAKAIAALSHPNILSIHDVGTQDGVAYAVTELLEGETLAERLARGPLPTEALARIGAGICAALTAAHRKGIVHRDLKPSNVMLTKSGVKLLDFGLAKPFTAGLGEGGLTSAQTAVPDVTREGSIVGTLSYMAPEQLESRPVDARTDIFALGSTLYEMATGKKPFEGQSQAAVLSAILTGEPPPLSAVRPMSPPALDRLVRTCLAKDPELRWQTAHDVGLQLQAIAEGSTVVSVAGPAPEPGRPRARWLPWLIAAVCAAAALASLAALLLRRPPPAVPGRVVRFDMPPPAGMEFVSTVEHTPLAVSPDGSRVAFLAGSLERLPTTSGGGSRPTMSVWIRELSSLEARRLPGTEDARSIFWSPDGRSLGFFTSGQLKRIDLAGGAPVPICDLPRGGGRSGTWGSAGDILFVNIQAATISRVPAAGGTPVTLVEGNPSRGEVRIFWPWYLPDGKRFVYILKLPDGANLMFSEPGKPPRALMPLSSRVQYCDPGYLVFVRDGVLLAQRFDWERGRLEGEPLSIADSVQYFLTNGYAAFAVSRTGTLVYQPHKNLSRIAWFDRTGRELSKVGPSGSYLHFSLSPDGRRLLYDRREPATGTFDIWSFDLSRGVETRLSSSPGLEIFPLEIPGGKGLVYSVGRGAQPQLCRRNVGSEEEELLAPSPGAFQIPEAVSPDGSVLVYSERTADTPFDIWQMPLSPPGKPSPVLRSRAHKQDVRFSPDGRFLSFVSDESGAQEVYVTPFPGPGERTRVSIGGGLAPRWSNDGREIFFLSPEGPMMAAPIRTSPTLQVGIPVEIFKPAGKYWGTFVPFTDGKRFLAIVPESIADEQPMTVVVNWTEQASRK